MTVYSVFLYRKFEIVYVVKNQYLKTNSLFQEIQGRNMSKSQHIYFIYRQQY